MNAKNQSESRNKLHTVDDIICAIKEQSIGGNCIFRGEPECYEKVSSNLYRELKSIVGLESVEIGDFQDQILEQAKAYTDTIDRFEILTELQHYGGKTNLIDFTKDYKVALFFACYGSLSKPGRIIIEVHTLI